LDRQCIWLYAHHKQSNHTFGSININLYLHFGSNQCTTSHNQANISYGEVPRTPKAKHADKRLSLVLNWLETLARPSNMSEIDYAAFIRYSMHFFIQSDKLWQKDPQGRHQLIADKSLRLSILQAAHDDVAHKGFYATNTLISLRFWWLHMRSDIAWYVKTCQLCQQ
jgi:hypothetical protein